MEKPAQITFRDFPPSEAVEARVNERIEKLETMFDRIIGCHVVLEAGHRRHHKGKLYHVAIDLSVPGGALVINRESHDKHAHEDIYVAIRDAFDALERQLQNHARKARGEIKAHEVPTHGTIARLFPDYGFIVSAEGEEIYFHRNAVVEGSFEQLEAGTEVRFEAVLGESDKGMQATTVKPVGKHHLP